MNALLAILVMVAIAVAIVVLLAANKPGTFAVARSVRLPAAADRIFPLIDDLRRHEGWSPFDRPDPATTKTHSGAAHGTGAVYQWHGGKAGAGRIEITESVPSSRIAMRLRMFKPIRSDSTVTFSLVPTAEATDVTWAMRGDVPFPAKIAHVFLDMDRMLGAQFERGLAELGALAARQ